MYLSMFMSHPGITPYKPWSLFPILSAEKLLSAPEQQRLMRSIERIVNLPKEQYDLYYRVLIYNFAEFVQVLPLFKGGPLGGMLNVALERALVCLEGLQENKSTSDQPLLTYTIFSSMLLKDLDRVACDKRIVLSDRQGIFEKEWMPYEKSMPHCGKYFKVRYIRDTSRSYFDHAALIFAKQVMPETGFLWIARNPHLLNLWFYIVLEEEGESGGFSEVMNMIQERLRQSLQKRLEPLPIRVEVYHPKDTSIGERFWSWLGKGLRNKDIALDDPESGVHTVDEGIFIGPAAFKRFGRVYPKYQDWRVTYQQFNAIGIPKLSGYDYVYDQHFSEYPEIKARKQSKNNAPKTNFSKKTGPLFGKMPDKKNLQPTQTSKISSHSPYSGVLISDLGLIYTESNKPTHTHSEHSVGKAPEPKASSQSLL